jgi:hypothetical protein
VCVRVSTRLSQYIKADSACCCWRAGFACLAAPYDGKEMQTHVAVQDLFTQCKALLSQQTDCDRYRTSFLQPGDSESRILSRSGDQGRVLLLSRRFIDMIEGLQHKPSLRRGAILPFSTAEFKKRGTMSRARPGSNK